MAKTPETKTTTTDGPDLFALIEGLRAEAAEGEKAKARLVVVEEELATTKATHATAFKEILKLRQSIQRAIDGTAGERLAILREALLPPAKPAAPPKGQWQGVNPATGEGPALDAPAYERLKAQGAAQQEAATAATK